MVDRNAATMFVAAILSGCGAAPAAPAPAPRAVDVETERDLAVEADPPAPPADTTARPNTATESPRDDSAPAQPEAPSGMELVGILTGVPPRRVLLRDKSGFGWVIHEGESRGGETLVRVEADRAVFRTDADGTERTVKLNPGP